MDDEEQRAAQFRADYLARGRARAARARALAGSHDARRQLYEKWRGWIDPQPSLPDFDEDDPNRPKEVQLP